jgi:hypothetical protein
MFWYIYGTTIVICHIPIVIDIIRLVRPKQCPKIPRVSGSISRYVLAFLTGLVFCVAILQHFIVFLPLVAPEPLHTLKGRVHVAFSTWVWINITVHFYTAFFTHPGEDRELPFSDSENQKGLWNGNSGNGLTHRNHGTRTDDSTTSELDLPVYSAESLDINNYSQNPESQTGMEWSPKRSNYCRVCRINVAYADHHCPYIGNCLGLRNYAHFFLGAIYSLLGLLYALYTTLPYFYRCDIKPLFGLMEEFEENSLRICSELGTQSRASIPILVVLWTCLNVVFVHSVLLLADISTFNLLKNTQRVPLLRFTWQRISSRRFLQPRSRFNVLLRRQRPNIFYYILPLRNKIIRLKEPISFL